MLAASLLLPIGAPGESRIAGDASHPALQSEIASAHVLFRIVIPQALSMEIAGSDRPGGYELIIGGNGPGRSELAAAGLGLPRLLWAGTGHHSIVQVATCLSAAVAPMGPGISCTVSMP